MMSRLAFAAMVLLPFSASAVQTPSPALAAKAAAVLDVLAGRGDPAAVFAPAFLAQVPAAQLTAIAAQLRAQHGAPVAVDHISSMGPLTAQVEYRYERAMVHAVLAVQDSASHLVIGLRITGASPFGDSYEKLKADVAALHGQAAMLLTRLDAAAPEPVVSVSPDRRLALGSAFKLYVLAELVREIEARERSWSDVVDLGQASLPSGILQTWPEGSPVTLHTLAALMISQSDNTATDTLIRTLGREKVEAVQSAAGHGSPAANEPFLTTRELFVLKGTPHDALARRWIAADVAGRRAMLPELAAVPNDRIDAGLVTGAPFAVDTIEWFASPSEVASVLDWIRRHTENGPEAQARAILGINPGLGGPAVQRLQFVGFKGGSETGVVTLNYLLRTRDERWYALSLEWNDPDAAVDTAAAAMIASRAVDLLTSTDRSSVPSQPGSVHSR